MIMTYADCINKYGTDYRVKKEIEAGRLFRKEKGIYTDEAYCSDIDIIQTKYPRAIFTGESAYYYYNLTDVIPDDYHLATVRTDSRIKDSSVKQYFINGNLFEIGKTTMKYHGTEITIYSRERLLVDLIRNKSKLSYDYYKEIINSYRRIAEELDFFKMEEYTDELRNGDSIMKAIELEVL